MLGQPLDSDALTPLAAGAGASLLVTDGRSAGAFAGPTGQRAALAAAVGRESEGPWLDRNNAATLTPVPLAPAGWVWVATDAGATVPLPLPLGVGTLAVLAAAGAVGLLARKRRSPGAERRPETPLPTWVGPAGRASLGLASPLHLTRIAAGHGQSFGRYTLIDRIGKGGMSELFTAALTGAEGFQRLYVIKRLQPEFAQQKAAVDQFIDEAKLGAQLVHGNIIPVLDFGQVGTGYFLAQEYIAGRNLMELCLRQRERIGEPLPAPIVCYIAHEVLDALAYAHERTNDQGEPLNIVHRDVSTGNVMVTVQGEVKLLDFGIMRASERERVSRTDVGHVKGNATFMSPEQARGQPVDGRADLFSLGMVIYYALTGEPLYKGLSSAEVFYQATTGLTADHLARIRLLPSPLAAILERALAIDPNQRYATARDFADVLAPFVVGGKAELATLVGALFGEDLRRQTASFRAKLAP